MMFGGVEAPLGQARKIRAACLVVALGADRISFVPQISGMGVMTIRTAHSFGVHSRLKKGAVDVDLLQDLPIRVVETLSQGRQSVCVMKGGARPRAPVAESFASRVATRTLLNLGFRVASREAQRQTLRPDLIPGPGIKKSGRLCPLAMCLAWAVARFTAHADFSLATLITAIQGLVALFVARRVTLGAARIEVLVG